MVERWLNAFHGLFETLEQTKISAGSFTKEVEIISEFLKNRIELVSCSKLPKQLDRFSS